MNHTILRTSRPLLLTASIATGIALSLALSSTSSAALFVQNGTFESNGGVGQLDAGITSLSNWTTASSADGTKFDFVANGTASSAGFPTVNSPPNLKLWGPGSGSANGFTISPNGGSFVALAGYFGNSALSQSISNLTVGQNYKLSFEWAAAQITDYSGATQESLGFTFGTSTGSTSTFNLLGKGFSGWTTFEQTFAATATSQTLSFLAAGTRNAGGMLLLDNVSLQVAPAAVPEPSTAAFGLLALGGLARRRRPAKA